MDYQDCIVDISKSSSARLVYCIHPLGGDIACYKSIAESIKDNFSVYGVKQAESESKAYLTIDELSHLYSKQIKNHTPASKISVIGWSMGGVIAFNMVKHLKSFNIEIDKLILIDSYTPKEVFDFSSMDYDELLYHLIRMGYANSKNNSYLDTPLPIKIFLWILINAKPSAKTLFRLSDFLHIGNLQEDLNEFKRNISIDDSNIDPIPRWISVARKFGSIPENISNDLIFNAYKKIRHDINAYRAFEPIFSETTIHYLIATKCYKNKSNNSDWRPYCNKVVPYNVSSDHYKIINNRNAAGIIKTILMAKD